VSESTTWVRAPRGGIFRLERRLGAIVKKNERLGVISSPESAERKEVRATAPGMLMGHAVNPLVHRGDALVHLALNAEPAEAP